MHHSVKSNCYWPVEQLMAVLIFVANTASTEPVSNCSSSMATLSPFIFLPASINGTKIYCPTTGIRRDTIISSNGILVSPTYEVPTASEALKLCTSNDGRDLVVFTTANKSERGSIEVSVFDGGQPVATYKINHAPPGIYKTAEEPFILMRDDVIQAFEVYGMQGLNLKLCQVTSSGALEEIDYIDVSSVSGASMCEKTNVGTQQSVATPIAITISSVNTPILGTVTVVIIEGNDCSVKNRRLTQQPFEVRVLNTTPVLSPTPSPTTTPGPPTAPQTTDIGVIVGLTVSFFVAVMLIVAAMSIVGLRKKIFPVRSQFARHHSDIPMTESKIGESILPGTPEPLTSTDGHQLDSIETEASLSDCDSGYPSTPLTKLSITVVSHADSSEWLNGVTQRLSKDLNASHLPLLWDGNNGASFESYLHQHLKSILLLCVIWEDEMPEPSNEPLAQPLPLYAHVYRILQANAGLYSKKVCFLKLGCPKVIYMKDPCHFICRSESSRDGGFSSAECARCIYDKVKEDIDSAKEDIEANRGNGGAGYVKSAPPSGFPVLNKSEAPATDPMSRPVWVDGFKNELVYEFRKGPVVDNGRNLSRSPVKDDSSDDSGPDNS